MLEKLIEEKKSQNFGSKKYKKLKKEEPLSSHDTNIEGIQVTPATMKVLISSEKGK